MPLFMTIAGTVCVLAAMSESKDKARSISFYFYGAIAFAVALITAI